MAVIEPGLVAEPNAFSLSAGCADNLEGAGLLYDAPVRPHVPCKREGQHFSIRIGFAEFTPGPIGRLNRYLVEQDIAGIIVGINLNTIDPKLRAVCKRQDGANKISTGQRRAIRHPDLKLRARYVNAVDLSGIGWPGQTSKPCNSHMTQHF
jgi:hypothetical protein